MKTIDYDYDVALQSMSPKRLKKGILRMLIISLQNSAEIGMEAEFTSKFFSDLQVLFDFLDDLRKIRKNARKTEEESN